MRALTMEGGAAGGWGDEGGALVRMIRSKMFPVGMGLAGGSMSVSPSTICWGGASMETSSTGGPGFASMSPSEQRFRTQADSWVEGELGWGECFGGWVWVF